MAILRMPAPLPQVHLVGIHPQHENTFCSCIKNFSVLLTKCGP